MNFFLGFVTIIFGFINIIYPQFAWYLKEGSKVNGDSEPSNLYLELTRISGIALIISGLFLFFVL